MELTRRFKLLLVSAIIILVISVDSGVISAPTVRNISKRGIGSDILCDACAEMASVLQKLVKDHVTEDIIEATAIELCEKLDIEDDYICKNIVPVFKV